VLHLRKGAFDKHVNVFVVVQNSDNATCYEEKPVSTKISETIWDHCEGREVLLLSPISCDVETEENGHLKETSRKLHR